MGAAGVRLFDRARLAQGADWLVVAIAALIPWSTSISQILTVIWLLALIPVLDVARIRGELQQPAGGLPALLWLMALAGVFWASVPWSERVAGLDGFHKLLVIPLLLAQFRHSPRGMNALIAFLASCTLLLAVSWILLGLWNGFRIAVPEKLPGLAVKDYIAQSSEFLICVFALLAVAIERQRAGQWKWAAGAVLLAGLFLANVAYVAPGRTALIIVPLLLLVLGLHYFGRRGVLFGCLAAALIGALAWAGSPLLRARVLASFSEVRAYEETNASSSSGIRLEIWKKSLQFVAEAPIIGHGTGSILDQFRRVQGESGAAAVIANNPHNQILAVAIQLGLVGTVLLLVMWAAHLALFRGGGLVPWIGIVVVVQNLVSAPFNSHLFDSFHGWLYVFGLGITGGMALRQSDRARRDGAAT